VTADRTYLATVGSQRIELPVVQVAPGVSIALLICVDHGVRFAEKAGRELAEILAPLQVEIVASVATMGIPLAIEVTRALGLDDYAILHKTPKIHLSDAIDEPVRSISTGRVATSSRVGAWRSSTTSSRRAAPAGQPSTWCEKSAASPSPSGRS
jgi:hypothetical protein